MKFIETKTKKKNPQKIAFVANSQPNSDDEEEEDIDYSPEEDEFKKVRFIKTLCLVTGIFFFCFEINNFF